MGQLLPYRLQQRLEYKKGLLQSPTSRLQVLRTIPQDSTAQQKLDNANAEPWIDLWAPQVEEYLFYFGENATQRYLL